jgi:hypothetical protein
MSASVASDSEAPPRSPASSDAFTADTTAQDTDLGDASCIAEDLDCCNDIIRRLEQATAAKNVHEQRRLGEWIQANVKEMAFARHGCRVVQKALGLIGGVGRDNMVAALIPHLDKLYSDMHGNHVVTLMIEMVPAASLGPVISKLYELDPITVSKHRFGCRAMERLIEHCSETEIAPLTDKVVQESEALCRHPFGNFVVQHLLEHGSSGIRRDILDKLLPTMAEKAMHRTASHVAQRALDHCDETCKMRLVKALLESDKPQFLEVAASRYGSFVIEQLAGTLRSGGPNGTGSLAAEVHARLAAGREELGNSQFGCRVLARFGFDVPKEKTAAAAEAEPA